MAIKKTPIMDAFTPLSEKRIAFYQKSIIFNGFHFV
jgi:hypothetical protein